MHIAVVNLTSGSFSGGYRKYLWAILPLMREDARVTRITVCSPAGASAADEPIAGVEHWTWDAHKRWGAHRAVKGYLGTLAPDVVLIPTARWIDVDGVPTAVMVRNMEPLVAPFLGNTLATSLKNIARRRVARSSCKRADRIVAVSQHVRDFLESHWSVDPGSIGLVYHGVSAPPARSEARAPATNGWTRPTLFTAGSIRPARGLEDAIRATAKLRADGRDATLLIAGRADSDTHHYERAMLRLCQDLGLRESVCWAGQLTASEMSWCFYNADAFVMTSRAEACPNTALEAMAHGALCVAGDNEPMPEFFAGAAEHYEPGDAASLARTLRVVLDAPADKQEAMRAHARRRATDFSWRETARRTVGELEKCTRRRG
jgi:glycosyltransferase involved in cell wall biosynthesis